MAASPRSGLAIFSSAISVVLRDLRVHFRRITEDTEVVRLKPTSPRSGLAIFSSVISVVLRGLRAHFLEILHYPLPLGDEI
jgi:hypothetical protein